MSDCTYTQRSEKRYIGFNFTAFWTTRYVQREVKKQHCYVPRKFRKLN